MLSHSLSGTLLRRANVSRLALIAMQIAPDGLRAIRAFLGQMKNSFRSFFRALILGSTVFLTALACDTQPAEVARAALPNGYELAIIRQPAHPFLAEYTRVVQLLRSQTVVSSDSLFTDTGGYGRLELFALGGDRYILRGPMQAHLINTAAASITLLGTTHAPTGKLLGVFDADSSGVWAYMATRDSTVVRSENRAFTG
jgi:hypothetical protein